MLKPFLQGRERLSPVTVATLTTVINTTAQNPSGVSPIGGSFAKPDLNVVKDKVNELIAAPLHAP